MSGFMSEAIANAKTLINLVNERKLLAQEVESEDDTNSE